MMKAKVIFFVSLGMVATWQGYAQQPKQSISAGKASCVTGGGLVSHDEFKLAFTKQEGVGTFPVPDESHYNYLVQNAGKGLISSKEEFAMFLAHVIQETAGQYYKEISCDCKNYAVCSWVTDPSKNKTGTTTGCYCGRGALQLSFPCNYAEASKFLYNDTRLLENPESVATSIPDIWGTALYYWNFNVHKHAVTGDFSKTTAAINGPCECDSVEGNCYGTGKVQHKGAKRCKIYNNILASWGLPPQPSCTTC
jgi:hypothetical protein